MAQKAQRFCSDNRGIIREYRILRAQIIYHHADPDTETDRQPITEPRQVTAQTAEATQ